MKITAFKSASSTSLLLIIFFISSIVFANTEPPISDPNGPYTGSVSNQVQFDGSGASDPEGNLVAYDWDFGDGGTGTGMAPTYSYAASGLYTVSLTVTDDAGATDTATTTADISERQQSEDTCKESDNSIDPRMDVDILSASYDSASDTIEVCAILCDDECKPGAQYRFHFDYDMEANGMASSLPDRDEDSCKISSIGNFTGTTSDDIIRFLCDRDGINYKKVTGPAENCTPVDEDGKFCCTVALESLVREDGSMVQECDAIDIWIDAHKKCIQDRAPDTNDSDGCSKPTGADEVLLFTGDDTAPEITCSADETIECDEEVDIDDPIITDQCDSTPTITIISGKWPGSCNGEWETSKAWTATDAAGNSSSCGTTVYQGDTTAPDIACIGTSVEATSPEGAEVDLSTLMDALDNCSKVQINCNYESGLFPIGSTDVTCNATDECGNTSNCEFSVIVIGHPAIDIEKLTNGEDADESPGPSIYVGALVTWTYVVTNTGDVPLENVIVSDNQHGSIAGPFTLQPGESSTYLFSGNAELGPYSNLGTATGTSPSGNGVQDDDPSHYEGVENPSIDIEKSTNGEDADTPTGPSINVGDPVTWTYVVTNTGDVPLANVVVTDSQLGWICNTDPLEVGNSFTCTAQGVAEFGQYSNLGTATGTSPSGNGVQDDDPSHYEGVENFQACCLFDGSCAERSPEECLAQGGVPQNPDTDCSQQEDLCITTACCLPDNTCAEVLNNYCEGVSQGPGSECNQVACPVYPTGACCLPDNLCAEMTSEECIRLFGNFYDGMECQQVNCDPT
jgi:PKD repeat protein